MNVDNLPVGPCAAANESIHVPDARRGLWVERRHHPLAGGKLHRRPSSRAAATALCMTIAGVERRNDNLRRFLSVRGTNLVQRLGGPILAVVDFQARAFFDLAHHLPAPTGESTGIDKEEDAPSSGSSRLRMSPRGLRPTARMNQAIRTNRRPMRRPIPR